MVDGVVVTCTVAGMVDGVVDSVDVVGVASVIAAEIYPNTPQQSHTEMSVRLHLER